MEVENKTLTQEELNDVMWNSLPWWRKEQLLRQSETGKDEIIKQKDKEIAALKAEIEQLREEILSIAIDPYEAFDNAPKTILGKSVEYWFKLEAEIERKDEAIKWAIQYVEDYDPCPEGNELYHVMKQVLSKEQRDG
jgi:hypothetical protein